MNRYLTFISYFDKCYMEKVGTTYALPVHPIL